MGGGDPSRTNTAAIFNGLRCQPAINVAFCRLLFLNGVNPSEPLAGLTAAPHKATTVPHGEGTP
jgi:hypothetical protein